jgi:hypothetical protein
VCGGGAGRVAGQTAFIGFKELLGSGVIQALSDCFAAISACDAFLKSEPIQGDADLVLGGMVLARSEANIADKL